MRNFMAVRDLSRRRDLRCANMIRASFLIIWSTSIFIHNLEEGRNRYLPLLPGCIVDSIMNASDAAQRDCSRRLLRAFVTEIKNWSFSLSNDDIFSCPSILISISIFFPYNRSDCHVAYLFDKAEENGARCRGSGQRSADNSGRRRGDVKRASEETRSDRNARLA